MRKDDGGPAFPTNEMRFNANVDSFVNEDCPGMTLRDWFAGKALVGMLADTETEGTAKDFARRSYEMADAMITERSKL
jgi:hypothetical protein